jgi:hypothetical protein
MGSNTVLVDVVKNAALVLLLLLLAPLDRSAFAQAELVGTWAARNTEDISRDSYPVDYLGLPLNDEGRLRALSYNEAQLAMVERQCEGWPPFYFVQGPFGLKIWSDNESVKGGVISFTIGAWEDRAPIVIWMDGRPHPSDNAEHTRGGFTTGKWEGDTLVAYTTHMKAGFLRKNGPPSSDQATMTTRFFRHGDILTVLAVVEDPAYLAEPHIITKSFQLATAPMCIDRRAATRGKRPAVHRRRKIVREVDDRGTRRTRCSGRSRRCIRSTGRRSNRRTCRSRLASAIAALCLLGRSGCFHTRPS